MKTFILAAGKQTRWLYNAPNYNYRIKQLVPIHGIPLIRRTLLQVPGEKYVVTKERKIIDALSTPVVKPEQNLSIVQTLMSTQKLWDSRTIILLGDVYYTAMAIKTIYDSKVNMFFGNNQEIFAISIVDPEPFSKAFLSLIETGTDKLKLWHLYRFMHGIPLGKHEITDEFTYIKDKTTDFDCVLQYLKWLKSND